ncbi:MAG: glutamate--tRNA ligase [Nanoarchaeota archaeon]|nr:glutamate--tRNA ligase [Nanoarchaeota archaeon]MBU1643525.1 glutamate--tRNA ligase [Nanoarchaeota archaeon]MBU1977369.1 glutamate--tRNA ligase [Nanoarchaeota archaeon]
MDKNILKQVLKNALDFDGKANSKAVLGQVLRDNPELKKDVPKTLKQIDKIVQEVQQLPLEEIKNRLSKLAPELLKGKAEEKIEGPLKPLPNAEKGKVVVRIAPSPSGPLHIGHAYGTSLNYEYAKMYDGKFIVRIEDTNPENLYPPAYDLIPEDAQWLTDNNVAEVIVQSSRLGLYYDCAEKLVNMEKAYVCTCDVDGYREMKSKGIACPCRDIDNKEQQLRYAKMFNEYAEGEAVLRLKTDIKHKNPAMRDFAILRINEHLHPKTGKEQRVWPVMVFSVAVDDHELGITHVLNGKEHADNGEKEKIIMEYFGWKPPVYKHWGRINFEGFKLSTSKTRLAIEQGEYSGWEDIRLPFLRALRKRGYQPEAFRKYALEIGLSLNDKKVTLEEFWKNINSFNKEIVESKANRYFFVDNPVEVTIENAPAEKVMLDLHPDFPERGKRELLVKGVVHVSESDFKRLGEDKLHRLMDYCNFIIKDNCWNFVSEDYDDYKEAENKGLIIHWLPSEKRLPKVEVLMEDNTRAKGLGEKEMFNLKEGDLVQLERRYFARLDKKEENKLTFYYLHK